MKSLDLVIWDWNGTLLNDRWLCIEVVNGMLNHRGLPQLDDQRYLDIFQFPVSEYYRRAGFDFNREPFAELAIEYLTEYDARVGECTLHEGVKTVLQRLTDRGVDQVILSASRQESLEDAVRKSGIDRWFSAMRGLSDGHAVSKVEAGHSLIHSLDVSPERTIMIGDTDHDGEVADALGIDLALVADGHQSLRRLKETGRRVFGTVSELTAWLDTDG